MYKIIRKIAVVSTMSQTPWGGSEVLWYKMCLHALQCNYTVELLLPLWNTIDSHVLELISAGATLRQWNRIGASEEHNRSHGLSPYSPYESLFSQKYTHTIISHGGLLDITFGHQLLARSLLAKKINYSVIVQCNTDSLFPDDENRALLKSYYLGAQKVFFVSHHNHIMAEKLLACSLPHAQVINNPLHLESTEPIPYPHNDCARFACVARLDCRAKGYDILLQCLGAPHWKKRSWKLEIYGAGVHRAYLEELSRHYSIADKVDFCGTVDDVRQVWRNNQILLMPSRYEGTALALLEALACGRSAVTTAVGGNADWIDDNHTGFVVAAPEYALFSEGLERAWHTKSQWEYMGHQAHKNLLLHHEIDSGITLFNALTQQDALPEAIQLCRTFFHPKKGQKEVSVVIPCYNYSALLTAAVESILKQTFQNFEIIIVDDGSTDDSAAVAHNLIKHYSDFSIQLVQQKNSGQPAHTRNTGIRSAQTDLVICLDADDTFETTMLEKCLSVFHKHKNVDLVYTDALYVDENNNTDVRISGEFSVRALSYCNQLMYSAMYKKNLWEKVGGYRLNVRGYEDWDFWLACALKNAQGLRIPEPLLEYRFKTGLWHDAVQNDDTLKANLIANNYGAFKRDALEWAGKVLQRPLATMHSYMRS